jgi:hypothetical protein
MPDRIFCLTDAEAALAVKGKLWALVKVVLIPGPDGKRRPITAEGEKIIQFEDGTFHYLSLGGLSGPYQSPFGAPGTVLLGKETWRRTESGRIEYKADKEIPFSLFPWRSPVTMPRFAIRHRFTVKESRATTKGNWIESLHFIGCYDDKVLESMKRDDWIWYAEVEKS